ncbi:acyl-ACP--UDP-N-acetylglucosamine O-acyltransferase [Methylocystis bryophila]|uniref:Acyl-[acyl-carrier-protein]--UDP-N-acetylglucosamine O-acyltransferase n=1 Tax=Methylocystis bryophila TaxID=655015 RepID=A0A1W6MZP5_9HYPH|nr:acyl-ACP--UDP-N-acetylglucosamine O-acyltransferase [Methylocystis bryophila]ARN83062.1 acyl-[acyl-carrier-protein]--UDP-N-acetylglucosamine O-acyltransferase [Methylocystis bryophila]BDV39372.1 acyl-[acyl-carrier-protein]--UDP-N-acetylglucosamine O-acyltransferase [Methylocystis bryophila]
MAETRAHPSAIIEAGARLGEGLSIGPYCHIGPEVEIGDGSVLHSHVVVMGATRLGPRAKVFPFAAIGARSQDLISGDGEGRLVIGADCIIREGVTINAGTREGGVETRIGDGCALLANSHLAHDCRLGDRVVLSNGVLIGGHVQIGDDVMIGGGAAVHQHARIGAQVFVAGLAGIEGDIIPFARAGGHRAHLFGLNLVGLRRRGYSSARIARLREAYRRLFPGKPAPREERIAALRAFAGDDPDINLLIEFLSEPSSRQLATPRPGGFARDAENAS